MLYSWIAYEISLNLAFTLSASGQGGATFTPHLPPLQASRTQKRRGIDASWKSFQLYHNSHDAFCYYTAAANASEWRKGVYYGKIKAN